MGGGVRGRWKEEVMEGEKEMKQETWWIVERSGFGGGGQDGKSGKGNEKKEGGWEKEGSEGRYIYIYFFYIQTVMMTEWPERRKKIKGKEKASNQSALTFLGAGRNGKKKNIPPAFRMVYQIVRCSWIEKKSQLCRWRFPERCAVITLTGQRESGTPVNEQLWLITLTETRGGGWGVGDTLNTW